MKIIICPKCKSPNDDAALEGGWIVCSICDNRWFPSAATIDSIQTTEIPQVRNVTVKPMPSPMAQGLTPRTGSGEYLPDEPDTGAVLDLSRPNVCYLRTFSKIFGLAGLRVGYIVGPTSIAHAVGRLRHWYDVTDIAHIAATLSLRQPEEITRRREATTAARLELEQIMRNNDLEPLPSVTGFLLAPTTAVATTVLRLEEQGVLVRAVVSGTQEYLRIAVGDADDRAQLESALQQLR